MSVRLDIYGEHRKKHSLVSIMFFNVLMFDNHTGWNFMSEGGAHVPKRLTLLK